MGRIRYRVQGPRHGRPYRRPTALPRPAAPSPPGTRSVQGRPAQPRSTPSVQPVLRWDRIPRVRPVPLAALVLRWLVIAVLCLAVLDIARVAGVPIVLFVLVWTGVRLMRRHPGRPHRIRARQAAGAPGAVTPRRPAPPARGNPYDLETYLKRLGEDPS
ncbi:hypothetical protein GCM10027449_03880 [Sinomonas notoginsengisoli]|uniref:hypothetical protein n=1 Tax=Sinomonas notoginsengisoli TaxID=1457311 RepID=UPI001F40DD89|nr:hypothetical protein [Sinomonas notoginsengisoli]